MGLFDWVESGIKKMHWYDMSLVKLTTFATALLLAVLWPPLLSLEWYWYLAIAVIAALRPVYIMLAK